MIRKLPSKFLRFGSVFGLVLASSVLLVAGSGSARAEGVCPPGQYPIGGQGVIGCAPIPSSGPSQSASPKPTGRWHKTWGAIAISTDGAAGSSVGKRRKGDASRDAELACAKSGSTSCKVAFTFHNQCGAAVVPTSGKGGTLFGRAETSKRAEEIAMNLCISGGGVDCKSIYSECSNPEFEAF